MLASYRSWTLLCFPWHLSHPLFSSPLPPSLSSSSPSSPSTSTSHTCASKPNLVLLPSFVMILSCHSNVDLGSVAGVIHAPFEGVDMATSTVYELCVCSSDGSLDQATIASPYVFGLIGVGCFGSLLHSGLYSCTGATNPAQRLRKTKK